jgi:hypothetical protein
MFSMQAVHHFFDARANRRLRRVLRASRQTGNGQKKNGSGKPIRKGWQSHAEMVPAAVWSRD